MSIIRLYLEGEQKIQVKTNPVEFIYTGSTRYNFYGSGATTVDVVNKNVTIYTPPTDLSDYWTTGQTQSAIDAATSGLTSSWNDIEDKPQWLSGTTIEDFQLAHTHSYTGLTDLPTLFDGDYNSLTNLPTLFSGSYNDLSDKPDLSIYLTGVTWSIITDKPTFFSGDYNDLSNKPTLFTGHTFTASGITEITQVGDNVTIYVPADSITGVTWEMITDKPDLWTTGETVSYVTGLGYITGVTFSDITGDVSGNTALQNALNLKLDNSVYQNDMLIISAEIDGLISGLTTHTGDTSIHYAQSAITITESQISDLQAYTLTGTTQALSDSFDSHTGDTSIHYPMSGISITESQISDFSDYALQSDFTGHTSQVGSGSIHFTGHTFTASGITEITQVGDNINIYVPADSITGVTFAMITGDVSGNTALQNALNLKLDNSVYQNDMLVISAEIDALITGVTANTATINALDSAFDSHTGDTSIHYAQSAITITESQISDFGNYALQSELTGLTSSFNSHTGDTSIHYAQSAITITESQISDFGTYALESDLLTVSGDTLSNTLRLDNLAGDDVYLSGTTGITLQDLLNYQQSAGRLTIQADMSSNGDGTVSVGAGTGVIKTEMPTSTGNTARELVNWGNIVYVTWSGLTSLALTDNAYNYIYYDGSDGVIKATTNINDVSYYEDFTLGRVVREGTQVTIRICGMNLWNFQRRVQLFGEEVFPVVRASGLVIGAAANRTFTSTEGILWAELINRFTVDAKLSGDTFNYWYRTNGTWTKVTGQTQINNTQYNNTATGLATIDNNRYGVHWVYAAHDGSYHVVYGIVGNYTLTQAQQAQPPAILPLIVSSYGTLCAKIIILKDATSFTEIQSAFSTAFVPATVTLHNDLGGIQGGAADDYQHLTTTQLGYVNDVPNKVNTSTFTGHTGNLDIHYEMSGISITTSQISDFPTLFTGNTFIASGGTQIAIDGDNVTIYSPTGGTGGGVAWGDITGTLSNQTDLQLALDGKSDTGHTHTEYTLQSDFTGHTGNTDIHYPMSGISITESQISDLKPYITGFTVTCDMVTGCTDGLYAPVSHTHAISGVTGLQAALDGKSDTGHTHTGVYVDFDTSIVSVTGTTTLDSTHQNKIIEASGTFTITLPNSMPTGYRVDIVNVGAGTITLAASTTLQSDGTKLATQYTGASAYHRGSNVWIAVGKLTT
jgi:hypothetical protein